MGYPGVLPSPNHEAIKKTIIAGLTCNCKIAHFSKFDRKSYFYPDMPKNYQISQYDLPFCGRGMVHISGKGFSGAELPDKDIGVTRIHLEEDVAKLTHFNTCSGVDYNRAGVPLMECVSEPDMHSADEAYAYLTALKQIMQYADISDCDMEKGQMRCDVNISIKPVGSPVFGTKIEIKNLNSFRAVHRSLVYEIWRQEQVLTTGGKLQQETRGWIDERGETYLMRTKESAHDYRYFPEPDLMPVTFTLEEIDSLKNLLPELPGAARARFVKDYGLTEYDAHVLTLEKKVAAYFDACAKKVKTPKILANWIISEFMRELSSRKLGIDECSVSPDKLAGLIQMIENNSINGKIAKNVFVEMLESGKDAQTIVAEKGMLQVTDSDAINTYISQVIEQNTTQVEQYLSGKTIVLQFLVGQVMKLSKGKANPQIAAEMLKKSIDAIK
jgi:aspartyl-tRNA(Asn)/glutamyl-tRNA(Gln) amidotransferase subunit B